MKGEATSVRVCGNQAKLVKDGLDQGYFYILKLNFQVYFAQIENVSNINNGINSSDFFLNHYNVNSALATTDQEMNLRNMLIKTNSMMIASTKL